jgi:hypothetical protein
MLIHSLSTVTTYINDLDASLQRLNPSYRLTAIQKAWLGTVLMGIIVTGMLNWAAFERRSLGASPQSRLRWMFSWAKIKWESLLYASVAHILKDYKLTHGTLVADDTDKMRSKKTHCIPNVHKVKDKKTGGYFKGQELIFLVLVTETVTFPVSFCFYTPDPAMSAWTKQNKKLKKQGVQRKERPQRPVPNSDYPTKTLLTAKMIKDFTSAFPDFKIDAVLADALYGQADFINSVKASTNNAQVISQLKKSQLVKNKNGQWISLENYFARQPGVESTLVIRGGKKVDVTLLNARLTVKAHGVRRFIIALKYEGEADYRFIMGSDLSWRHQDIVRHYTLRWLVEVFIQDWKGFGGWNQLAKQQGEKGSMQGVILSLLCDHLLLVHPKQSALLKNKQPGMPVGCLIEHLNAEALVETIKDIVTDEKPLEKFKLFSETLYDILPNRQSKKHMAGRDLGRIEPTASLIYQNAI